MNETLCPPHEYSEEGKCLHCDALTGDAFWAIVAAGLGMKASKGTTGLRLRPGKDPEWIPAQPAPKETT